MRILYLFFTLLLLPILTGCSNHNPQGRIPVHGEVSFDGKPLEKGEILFTSVEGVTPKVAAGTQIKNGKYSLPAKQGLIPEQTYIVQFRSVEVITGKQNGTTEDKHATKEIGFQTRNIIPLKYGVNSKETVTATKKSPNVFNFDLINDAGK
ncbi:MAG: hypothetical protein LBB88_01380 [Planctomycetaceae bacterium]|jgi:hypothetical protein|nr:hypothetical protein [Planctomycetaceae bacterium]